MNERIIYGINTVRNVLGKQSDKLVRVYLQNDLGQQRLARFADELRNESVAIEKLSADELQALTGTAKHQGVAAAMVAGGPMDDHQDPRRPVTHRTQRVLPSEQIVKRVPG